jgi:hypothetical protein
LKNARSRHEADGRWIGRRDMRAPQRHFARAP